MRTDDQAGEFWWDTCVCRGVSLVLVVPTYMQRNEYFEYLGGSIYVLPSFRYFTINYLFKIGYKYTQKIQHHDPSWLNGMFMFVFGPERDLFLPSNINRSDDERQRWRRGPRTVCIVGSLDTSRYVPASLTACNFLYHNTYNKRSGRGSQTTV